MKVTISSAELRRCLDVLSRVIPKDKAVPVLQSVRFKATEELTITATDLNCYLTVVAQAIIDRPGEAILPSKVLEKIVAAAEPDAAITLSSLEEGRSCFLTCGAFQADLNLYDNKYPAIPTFAEPLITIPAAVLYRVITQTVYAITREQGRYSLNAAPDIRAVATDNHRLAISEDTLPNLLLAANVSVLVDRSALYHLLSLLAESPLVSQVKFGQDSLHNVFQFGPFTLVSRSVLGKFPDYTKIAPSNEAVFVVSREHFVGALRRLNPLAGPNAMKPITLHVDGSSVLKLSATNVDIGNARENLQLVSYDAVKDPIRTAFDARYLLDFLEAVTASQIKCELGSKLDSPALFTLINTNNEERTRYIVMPVASRE